MIRKSGRRFSEKIMLKQKIERDDDSKKSHLALGDTATGGGKSVNGVRMPLAARSELVAEASLHRVDAGLDIVVASEPEMLPLGTKEKPRVQHYFDPHTAGEAHDEMGVGVVRHAPGAPVIWKRGNRGADILIVKVHIGPAIDVRLPQREADKSIRQEIVDGVCSSRPQRA